MIGTIFIQKFLFRYLPIFLSGAILFTTCTNKENKSDVNKSGDEITATFEFSNGKTVDFSVTPKKDDIIKPSVNGPNVNNQYKLWLREKKNWIKQFTPLIFL